MYSGQEIVSQEECKIILAKFFEGVDCYNATDHTIKFTILDQSTLNYNSSTKTLSTRDFSCRPVLQLLSQGTTFEVGLEASTTGLEVIMHTGDYSKTRIMPLMYLRTCNSFEVPDPTIVSYPYLEQYCITDSKTKVVFEGQVQSLSATKLSIVGLASFEGEPLNIELFDASDNLLNLNPSFTTETRKVKKYVLGSEKHTYELKEVDVTYTIMLATRAESIKLSGVYKSGPNKLYACDYILKPGNVSNICNSENPRPQTEITVTEGSTVSMSGGWLIVGTSKLKLLPTMSLKSSLSSNPLYFALATQVEYSEPFGSTYDISSCGSKDPGHTAPGHGSSAGWFSIYFFMYYDEVLKDFYMDLVTTGDYEWSGNSIVNLAAGMLQVYTWFNGKDVQLRLSEGTAHETKKDDIRNLSITKIPVRFCTGYYKLDPNIYTAPIPGSGARPDLDYRLAWDPINCIVSFNCDSTGLFLPDCVTCTDVSSVVHGQGISLTLNSMAPDAVCTCTGEQLGRDTSNGCHNGSSFAFGIYPYIELGSLSVISKASAIYFRGLEMFIKILTPTGRDFYVSIGRVDFGIEGVQIIDAITSVQKPVSFSAFFYLKKAKIPFKYLNGSSFDFDSYWYDRSLDKVLNLDIFKAPGFDFGIELWVLKQSLPPSFFVNYEWFQKCKYVTAAKLLEGGFKNQTIYQDDLEALDDLDCTAETLFEHGTSNLLLRSGLTQPTAAAGALQEEYETYADSIKYLVSSEAEVFAYTTHIYQMNLKDNVFIVNDYH